MDSFETRYTYFLGQSTNFVLFRILKFGFSDFHRPSAYVNFFKSLLVLHFPMDSFETMYTYYLGQSSHLLFIVFKFAFFFLRIFIKFSLKSLLLLQFPMDSFATRYTYSLGQSSHLHFRFLKFVFFLFFGRIFIQVSFNSLLLLQYLMDSFEILTEKMASVTLHKIQRSYIG